MDKEKRSRERFPTKQILELSTSDGQQLAAQGVNVSEGGVLCRTDVEVPVGTFIMFNMTIPTGKSSITVPCEGTVLRCEKRDGKFDVVINLLD